MTDDVWVHLPPQAGSSPWRRSFALDLATRDGGDASGVFRRAEAYLAWLAGEQGGEFEALGHPEATNSPRTTADNRGQGCTRDDASGWRTVHRPGRAGDRLPPEDVDFAGRRRALRREEANDGNE